MTMIELTTELPVADLPSNLCAFYFGMLSCRRHVQLFQSMSQTDSRKAEATYCVSRGFCSPVPSDNHSDGRFVVCEFLEAIRTTRSNIVNRIIWCGRPNIVEIEFQTSIEQVQHVRLKIVSARQPRDNLKAYTRISYLQLRSINDAF